MICKPNSTTDKYYYQLYHYGTYLHCDKYPEFNNGKYLFVVYRFFNHSFYKEFEKELSTQSNLVKTVDFCEDKVLFIFEIPKEYLETVELFKEGKYSKFSQDAKSLIIAYSAQAYKYPPLLEDLTGVLWKHKTRREKLEKELGVTLPKDSELASKINYENETFYIPEECQS